MFYYLIKYSFDPEKRVVGPFDTEETAWNKAATDAKREVKISREEGGTDTDIVFNRTCNEITIIDHYPTGDDTTDYIVFKV